MNTTGNKVNILLDYWTARRLLLLIALSSLVFALGTGAWAYRTVWGFGGFFTHINEIPIPETVTEDHYTTPLAINAAHTRWRLYRSNSPMADLIAFHRQTLPTKGWETVRDEAIAMPRKGDAAHCIVAKQRNVTAYIHIMQGRDPENGPLPAVAVITINSPSIDDCS